MAFVGGNVPGIIYEMLNCFRCNKVPKENIVNQSRTRVNVRDKERDKEEKKGEMKT